MKHFATPKFWAYYRALPAEIQSLADEKFALLKSNSRHPSLHFKQIEGIWSCRVGLRHRALGIDVLNGVAWFWIGTHADYDRLIASE